MSKRSPRLLFTQEERTAPELKKAIRKADKRMKKLEKAEAKIPKKTVKKKQRVVDPKTGTVTTRLSFEEVDKKRPPSKLTHALRDAPGAAALSAVHREIREHEQDKSPYPTRADYPALIENVKPALRELLEAASYERRIAVLNECSLDVVNTVCTIMVLGRHSLYLRRKKPFNAPDAVFVRWAADLWTLREQDKAGDIRYLCGKTDLREYLSQGLQLLRIDLTEGGTYARETR